MSQAINIHVLSRRSFMLTATAAAVAFRTLVARAEEAADELTRSEDFETELKKVLGGAEPVEGKIEIDLPQTAENGNFVPITIKVESPMTDQDYVKTVHLLSTSNPVARVATYHLTPINAVARIQSRMRLARTQDVFVAAEMSTGEIAVSSVLVNVMIGGCGG